MKKEHFRVFRNNIRNAGLLLIMTLMYFSMTGFFNYFQSAKINPDGSGTLNIVYSASVKDVEGSKFQIGNFPFGEKNIRDYFYSPDVSILKSQIAKPGDTSYMVILDLQFKNLNSLNSLKAFSQLFEINVLNTDTGSVIRWNVNSNEDAKSINLLNFIMNFDGGIKSGNGSIKDGSIKWAKTDFSKSSEYIVTLNSKFTGAPSEEKKDPPQVFDIDKKPCGLFGMEFFVISLIGIIMIYPLRKKEDLNKRIGFGLNASGSKKN